MSVSSGASRLSFVEAARAAFDVLLDVPYRFVLAAQGGTQVRYETDAVVVVVFHDRLSYELDVQVARVGVADEVERPYTVQDLMRVTDPEAARSYKRFAATTPDAVRRGTALLVEQVRRYGDPALLGSSEFYELLASARAEAIREFGEDWVNRAAKRKADEAWAVKDYQGVASAYASVSALSAAENQRLRIARRHLGDDA
jgi:hypothetical protein